MDASTSTKTNGQVAPESGAIETPDLAPLTPLHVSALVVTKEDLIASLRIYVPQLIDIAPLDDGRFMLSIGAAPAGDSEV